MPFIGNKPTAVPLGTSDLEDNIVTVDKLADTLDLSGNTVTLPSGVGGKVLQVVSNVVATGISTTSSSYVEAGNATITPSSTSNKVLIHLTMEFLINQTSNSFIASEIYRGTIASGTSITAQLDNGLLNNNLYRFQGIQGITFLDSPSTTSSQQYTVGIRVGSGGTSSIATANNGTIITLMEVAG